MSDTDRTSEPSPTGAIRETGTLREHLRQFHYEISDTQDILREIGEDIYYVRSVVYRLGLFSAFVLGYLGVIAIANIFGFAPPELQF